MVNTFHILVEHLKNEKEAILKLEEVDSREAALKLYNKEIFVEKKLVRENPITKEKENEFSIFLGFIISDQELGLIGKIIDIAEYPQQIMAFVEYEGKEIMIPLNETFILEIDPEKKTISMDLPRGLISID